jgi:hypothetical protein
MWAELKIKSQMKKEKQMKTYENKLVNKYEHRNVNNASELALLDLAIENESALGFVGQRLDMALDNAVKDLRDAQRDLQDNPNSLNSCGILQSLNTSIDVYTAEIKARLAIRNMYVEALKLS